MPLPVVGSGIGGPLKGPNLKLKPVKLRRVVDQQLLLHHGIRRDLRHEIDKIGLIGLIASNSGCGKSVPHNTRSGMVSMIFLAISYGLVVRRHIGSAPNRRP